MAVALVHGRVGREAVEVALAVDVDDPRAVALRQTRTLSCEPKETSLNSICRSDTTGAAAMTGRRTSPGFAEP